MQGWQITLIVQVVSTIILGAFLLGSRNSKLTATVKDVERLEDRLDTHGKVLDKFENRVSRIEGKMNGFLTQ